ncbi:hypothetical protein [uncultured Hyphomonas sp.]|uniref:hypothetical protein n=1 Tax=uncultured Hyphomonas sp. TaxID=225298 RepID=UPI002AAB2AAE|nr:hypothetical protein [uncultured Hyphomonas sp.]
MGPSTIRPSMIVGGTLIGFFLDSLISGDISARSLNIITSDFQRWGITAILLVNIAVSIVLYDHVQRIQSHLPLMRKAGWRNVVLLLALSITSTATAYFMLGLRPSLSLGIGLAFFVIEAIGTMSSSPPDQVRE